MARRLPPLHTLAAFEAASRLRSFARAAEELCVTQSAVSHRIRQLEAHLEAPLFHRLSREVVPTAAGRELLGTVREVLDILHEAMPRLARSARRTVRLTCAPAFAQAWLVPRLERFHARHPATEVEIQTGSANASFRDGEFDVGLRFGTPPWPGTVAHALFDDVIFPVASPAYAKAKGPWRRARDLLGARLLRCRRMPWKPWFEGAGLDAAEPAGGPSFSEMDLMMQAAILGQGVALLPRTISAPSIAQGLLVQACGPRVASARRYHVLHAEGAGNRPEVRDFVAWVREEARKDRAR